MKLQIAGWLSRYQSAAACAVRKPAAANNGFDGNVKLTNLGPKRGKSNPPDQKSLNGGGVVLLKWGQRKRSKRTVADKSSGEVSMKPPPSKSGGGGGTTGCRGGGVAGGCGGTYLRPPRKLEDEMGGGSDGSQSPSWKSEGGSRSISRSVLGKRSHSSTIDGGSKGSTMRKDQSENPLLQSEHPNGKVTSPPPDDRRRHNQQGKSNGEEWPRIHIGLSRKEKEEDFLAIKATKLSHRPKKRSKAVDRNLQPKRGGLKGLESMDSYSD